MHVAVYWEEWRGGGGEGEGEREIGKRKDGEKVPPIVFV